MATSERPPPPPRNERPFLSEDEEDEEDVDDRKAGTRRIVQRLIGEGVRRAVEKGVEQITEGPENIRQLVQDMKLPREVANLIFAQVDETKNGLYRATAREIRDFLNETNLAEEIVRALTTLSFEIRTEIRFVPNDQKVEQDPSGKLPKPDVKATVRIKDEKKDKEE